MTVYLKTNRRLFNLSLAKNICLQGDTDSVQIDDVSVFCETYEVAVLLHEDICEALNKEILTGKGAWIEAFIGDYYEYEPKDKYSLKLQDLKKQKREHQRKEALAKVLDAIKKKATTLFLVECTFLVKSGRYLMNESLRKHVYAENEKTVEAWVREHEYGSKKDSDFRNMIEDAPKIQRCGTVYACDASLYGAEILDAKYYEKKKELEASDETKGLSTKQSP